MGRVRCSLRVDYSASLNILVGFEFVNSLRINLTQNRELNAFTGPNTLAPEL